MKTVDMAEGRGPNPYYAGNFMGESDELRDLRLSLVAERDALKLRDVSNILIDVVPGEDGMSREVYAQSTDQVVEVLTKLSEQCDTLQMERDALKAELERIKALPPVAWMYDRAGSAFNPQFLPADPNADQRRNGIVSEGVVILNPDSACKNWQPLIALGSKTS